LATGPDLPEADRLAGSVASDQSSAPASSQKPAAARRSRSSTPSYWILRRLPHADMLSALDGYDVIAPGDRFPAAETY
jgi:hypothetical protein